MANNGLTSLNTAVYRSPDERITTAFGQLIVSQYQNDKQKYDTKSAETRDVLTIQQIYLASIRQRTTFDRYTKSDVPISTNLADTLAIKRGEK